MRKAIYTILPLISVGAIIFCQSLHIRRVEKKLQADGKWLHDDYEWLRAGRVTDLSNTINLANYQETNQTQLREWVIRLAELTAKVEAQCREKHTPAVGSHFEYSLLQSNYLWMKRSRDAWRNGWYAFANRPNPNAPVKPKPVGRERTMSEMADDLKDALSDIQYRTDDP